MTRRGWLLLVVWCSGLAPVFAQAPANAPDRWEPALQAFEKQDAASPFAKGQNVFVGSSSVRLWKLDEAFPEHKCLNRGFGGSQLADVARYAERLVLPHAPKVIVVYAGDNDLAAKRTPEQVRDDYVTFVGKVRAKLPDAKIVWVAIKPSPKRWAIKDAGLKANALVRTAQEADPHSVYVDIWTPFLGDNGEPRRELFVKDELHLSPAGYEIWNRLVKPHLVER
jgi:lysophospholipase L1-like esterase